MNELYKVMENSVDTFDYVFVEIYDDVIDLCTVK